jgi:hypothetical protein
MKETIYRRNPVVDKKYLNLLAGICRCGAGVILISFAVFWLDFLHQCKSVIFEAVQDKLHCYI